MTGDPSEFDPQGLWQSQKKELDPMTLAEVHAKARAFDSKIQRRNAIEYVAVGVVIVGFVPALLNRNSWLMQAGAALIMLAAVYVAWQLHRRGSSDSVLRPGETLVEAHRRQLIRQRDALRGVGLWYIAPMIPGLTLITLGRWFQAHSSRLPIARDHAVILVSMAIMILALLGVWLLNLRGAKLLQRRIDEL